MHVQVNIRADNKALLYSIIYADNYYVSRRALWNNLDGHASLMCDKPWVVLDDFNAALNLEDHSCGGYQPDIAMREFKECVQWIEVMDVNATGLHFTWNQKPKASKGILKKINRIMYFRGMVSNRWNLNVHGCAMYRVVKRLKGLKTPLRKLLHNQGNLHDRVNRLRMELNEAQKAIDHNPSCSLLRDEHAHYLLAFKEASLDEERFLRIEMVRDSSNVLHEGNTVPSAFAEFMVREVSDSEIKDALFSIGDDKAPGPDGFTVVFFKKSWDIVGGEIINAVRDFFSNDDLFLFARGHPNFVRVIIDALEEFKNVSGLVPSIPKSTAFFCNVPNALKANILSFIPFAEGTLPVKYLGVVTPRQGGNAMHNMKDINIAHGVPFISSIILYRDCKILVEKLESRVNDWRNKFLSLACHLLLVRSVLSSMHIYWALVFILPIRIIHELEQLMRGFLWCQGEMKKGKAKVAWEAVCLPHREGGLGIRKLDDFNVALMATIWPHDWSSRFPNVVNIPVPEINNELDDLIVWRDVHGVFHRFTIARAWDSLQLRADVVDWYHVVWFPHCIPQHALHMWLVIKEKLKTQDRLWQWDIRAFTDMSSIPPRLVDVLAFLIPSKGSSVSNVISRIVLAAITYCLWNEQNSRLLKKKKSTADQVVQLITSLVRMKLVTFKFKKVTTGSRLLLDQWKIPSSCFDHDRSSR
ncbi:sodium/hydrogen exchanger 6 [Tanacetum coccineum]